MKEGQILSVSEFQRDRLLQMEEGIHNINNVERAMQFSGQDVLFSGPEDEERQIDREIIHAAKGGLGGVYNELKDEGLKDVAN